MDPARQLADEGYFKLDRLFAPDLVERMFDEYCQQYGELSPDRLPAHLSVGSKRAQLPIAMRGPLLDPMFFAHPLLRTIIEPILGDDFLIDSVSVVIAFPGAGEQDFHADYRRLFSNAPPRHEERFALTLAVPLVDLDETIGGTRVYPGSHLCEGSKDEVLDKAGTGIHLLVKRGGCYMMDLGLFHRGMANRSNRPRPVIFMVFSKPWFIDPSNFRNHERIMVRLEDVQRLPVEQRRMFRRIAGKGAFDITENDLLES